MNEFIFSRWGFGLLVVVAFFVGVILGQYDQAAEPTTQAAVVKAIVQEAKETPTPFGEFVPPCVLHRAEQTGEGVRVRTTFECQNSDGFRLHGIGWPSALNVGQQINLNITNKAN